MQMLDLFSGIGGFHKGFVGSLIGLGLVRLINTQVLYISTDFQGQ